MANTANRSQPYRIASPPHARLQTPAPWATPQPKHPGWWLGRFQPISKKVEVCLLSDYFNTFMLLFVLLCIMSYGKAITYY
ncbi:hypothetical protein HanOQP8_Chr14g0520581 [Helianthus annuus]|nr:hypothetical protein HanHA89_Chr14g0559881 [Helianthus annuus]KAJ0655265.1 hypothetical protein HanLR1_Chr14g0522231 [Helianthus annuus]KAJ0658960.1 hypothetical protein HanOQP8_Chr14g0520581 [Helianthus annuus]